MEGSYESKNRAGEVVPYSFDFLDDDDALDNINNTPNDYVSRGFHHIYQLR